MYSQPLSKQRKGKQKISKGPNLDGATKGFRKKSWSLEFKVFC